MGVRLRRLRAERGMTQAAREGDDVREIAIAKIEILNPRERNQKVFREIVGSIRLRTSISDEIKAWFAPFSSVHSSTSASR